MSMSKTEVWFVRHGETCWNVERRYQGHGDSELTEAGRTQVEATGVRFQNITFDHLYSSDLGRARSTAEAIARNSGHEIQFDPRLREKNLGIFEGLTVPEIQARYLDPYIAFKTQGTNFVIPEGESTQQLFERAWEFLEEMRTRYPGQRTVCVTHGGTIRGLMKHILGLVQDMPTRFRLHNTSLHQLYWVTDHWMVDCIGDTQHLTELPN